MKFKESYGIACCRFNLDTEKPEVLLIKKRYTYAFFEFVFSKYRKYDDAKLRKLFNQMSIQEKMEILRLDFDRLWCKILVEIPDPPSSYISKNKNCSWNIYLCKKRKFDYNFIIPDKGKRLRKLINDTISIDSIWEIPKGRPMHNEKPINTAIREFMEETNISINDYHLLMHIKPLVESYTVNRCHYKHTYFIAVANSFDWEPELNFSSYEQMKEVENIQWISLDRAKYINLKQIEPQLKLSTLLNKIVKIFKQNYKFSNIIK